MPTFKLKDVTIVT